LVVRLFSLSLSLDKEEAVEAAAAAAAAAAADYNRLQEFSKSQRVRNE
jgi:hypothetical protein